MVRMKVKTMLVITNRKNRSDGMAVSGVRAWALNCGSRVKGMTR